jgi:hypothetical protein
VKFRHPAGTGFSGLRARIRMRAGDQPGRKLESLSPNRKKLKIIR